jgi:hypothetical protein
MTGVFHGWRRRLHIHVAIAPGRLALADIEPRLEGLRVLAVEAAALFDMDLEAGALGQRVVARAAQAERGVEHVQARTSLRSLRKSCQKFGNRF